MMGRSSVPLRMWRSTAETPAKWVWRKPANIWIPLSRPAKPWAVERRKLVLIEERQESYPAETSFFTMSSYVGLTWLMHYSVQCPAMLELLCWNIALYSVQLCWSYMAETLLCIVSSYVGLKWLGHCYVQFPAMLVLQGWDIAMYNVSQFVGLKRLGHCSLQCPAMLALHGWPIALYNVPLCWSYRV